MDYVILATGLAILLVCGDFLVRGAVALAQKLNISPLVIGLTVVAFGTSAPELVVSIRAAIAGSPGISLGNVVGSNIANILLVLGLPAIISATSCNQKSLMRNMLYVTGASLIFIALCFMGPLSFWHGAILFTLIVAFLLDSARRATTQTKAVAAGAAATAEIEDPLEEVDDVPSNNAIIALFLALGIIGLPLGAHFTVSAASSIALSFGVSEAVIGLSIVAIGTSLPELAAAFAAATRGNCALVMGNVLGSNLFNLLAVMGVTAMIAPIPVPDQFLNLDLWVMLAATLILIPFVAFQTRITRIPAIAFVLAYIAYIYLVFAPRLSEVSVPGQ